MRLKHWPWIHSVLPRGSVCVGGKSTSVRKFALCLGKHKNFQKQRPPSSRGDIMSIMIILIFHMAKHLLAKNIASLLHTVNAIFCPLSSRVPATSAGLVPHCSVSPGLQRPPEQRGTAGRRPPRVPAAWQPLSCPGQASWDSLRDQGCQGAGANRLWMTLHWWFKAKLPVLVITQLCTTCISYAAQLRTEGHCSKWLSKKTEKEIWLLPQCSHVNTATTSLPLAFSDFLEDQQCSIEVILHRSRLPICTALKERQSSDWRTWPLLRKINIWLVLLFEIYASLRQTGGSQDNFYFQIFFWMESFLQGLRMSLSPTTESPTVLLQSGWNIASR